MTIHLLLLVALATLVIMSTTSAFSPPNNEISTAARTLRNKPTISSQQSHMNLRLSPFTSTTALLKLVSKTTVLGPPPETKPDYSSIHGPLGPLVDRLLLILFRSKMASRLKRVDTSLENNQSNKNNNNMIQKIPDSKLPLHDFQGIIELTSQMNSQYNNRTQVQQIAQEVLVSLFPTFILDRYPSWFAKPFPEFSAKMCAWATVVGGTWLMGECEVNDIPKEEVERYYLNSKNVIGDNIINGNNNNNYDATATTTWGKNQGVLVKRCRFLEESQCASICVNSCRIPTQNFFRQNMGLDLTMTPNYETGECQFSFGRSPTEEEEMLARSTPCLSRCPSGGGMRSWHDGGGGRENNGQWLEDLKALAERNDMEKLEALQTNCALMED